MKKVLLISALIISALTSCTEVKKQITVESVVYGIEIVYTTEDFKSGDVVRIGYNLDGTKEAHLSSKAIGHISTVK